MLVTFISECEKKALKRTRRVLDTFANRIGNNAWQTPITEEGLLAVKKLLRKTASKNTAISCHQLKSRVRTELLWVVGNRGKFNDEGFVAVNYTGRDMFIGEYEMENIRLIRALAIIAALFHDFGKASKAFQAKLKDRTKTDAFRHEWVSVLLLSAFVNGRQDDEWLEDLSKDGIDEKFNNLQIDNIDKPLNNMPIVASIIAWLVLSHHRLPALKKYQNIEADIKQIFSIISHKWNDENKTQEQIEQCYIFDKGLPSKSEKWRKQLKKWSLKLQDELSAFEQCKQDGNWRIVVSFAKISLMLADYHFSSQEKQDYQSELPNLYANTDKSEFKQYLDEHILGVARQANKNVSKLLDFEKISPAFDNKELKKPSPSKYEWQDKAVKKIKNWRNKEKLDNNHFGFFAVNMASTGTGKTFANAKIMRALSPKMDSLRFILAIGLRTLTLQTGDEYRKKIKLDKDELAVLIGSKAILNLHNDKTGSESERNLHDGQINYSGEISRSLDTILRKKKDKQLLYAPVLSCTIDHIISATEITRGGRYILPTLRLMSSDLVIDEVDDFDGEDLIAIARLIHLTGMLGRKVMISSATIPPDLADGFFHAYQAGWQIFAQMRKKEKNVACLWVDEFKAVCKTSNDYSKQHKQFVGKRIDNLKEQAPKRKTNIVAVAETARIDGYFSAIKDEILNKHQDNHFEDKKSNKISIGVVRVANTKPCIELTKFLLNCDMPENTEIRVMAYHSRQVLLMRNAQEKYLDSVIKHRNKYEKILDENIVKKSQNKNIIFVLVATPVEEVGRDHDFDWAIIEPSSFRSFIQLAGRVLRHRDIMPSKPNIAIMQYNIRHLTNNNKEDPAFCWPGYETKEYKLSTHNLQELINIDELSKKIDATNRIQKSSNPKPKTNLSDLEHDVIYNLLTNHDKKGPETIQGWIESDWWLTGVPQKYVRFRANNSKEKVLYLTLDGFAEKSWENRAVPSGKDNITIKQLSEKEMSNLWIHRNYNKLLKTQADGKDIEKTALIYGEINIPTYNKPLTNQRFVYYEQLGLVKGD